MIIAATLTKLSLVSLFMTSLPLSSQDIAISASFDNEPVSQIQVAQTQTPTTKIDFTKLSLGTSDLFHDGEVNVMLRENNQTFDSIQNVVATDARGGSDLKYHNIATFSIGKNNRLTKEDRPTLFGERVLNELTGIQLAK